MRLILTGDVEDVQLGAFLMLLRVKEESPEELAGFVRASRDYIASSHTPSLSIDLDWSSYAGKRKQPHWFILAALLLAQSGKKVIMHGARGHTQGRVYTEDTLLELGINSASTLAEVENQLEKSGFAFLPLAKLCPPLDRLIGLRPMFGLRSPVHTLCRLLNPLAAQATLQSVFHPAYMDSHQQAAKILNEQNATVIKGDAGEFEYRPHASVKLKRLSQGKQESSVLTRRASPPTDDTPTANKLAEFWACDNAEESSPYAFQAVIGTTAIALLTMNDAENEEDAFAQAHALWQNRRPNYFLSNTTQDQK